MAMAARWHGQTHRQTYVGQSVGQPGGLSLYFYLHLSLTALLLLLIRQGASSWFLSISAIVRRQRQCHIKHATRSSENSHFQYLFNKAFSRPSSEVTSTKTRWKQARKATQRCEREQSRFMSMNSFLSLCYLNYPKAATPSSVPSAVMSVSPNQLSGVL
jgi:hypothetical protein